jgi:heat shock protein HslJ
MRRLLLCSAILVLMTAAACGEDWDAAPTAPSEPSVTPAVLEGRFVSTEVRGHDLVDGTEIQLELTGDDLGFSAGCNQMGGAYVVEGTTMRLDGPARATMMGCEPDLQAQDEWLTELLSDGVEFELDGSELTLVSGDVTVVLEQDA